MNGRCHRTSRKCSWIVALVILLVGSRARGEASHHAGAAAGQVTGAAAAIQSQALTAAESSGPWQVRFFGSYLSASHVFDDRGSTTSMGPGAGVSNYTINLYAERQLGEYWAISALTGLQVLSLRQPTGSSEMSSLSDSILSTRFTTPLSWGALGLIGSVKLPGTYAETALTNTKQVDAQVEFLALARPWSRVGIVGTLGYRVRFGGIQDEIIATVSLPVQVTSALMFTPLAIGAVPVGLGEVARNSVLPGASLTWVVSANMDVSASYYRTVYGRNVAVTDIVVLQGGAMF